jgi:hypothetical protein
LFFVFHFFFFSVYWICIIYETAIRHERVNSVCNSTSHFIDETCY